MRYFCDDAPRTGERNVILNKNISENVASNKNTIFLLPALIKLCGKVDMCSVYAIRIVSAVSFFFKQGAKALFLKSSLLLKSSS